MNLSRFAKLRACLLLRLFLLSLIIFTTRATKSIHTKKPKVQTKMGIQGKCDGLDFLDDLRKKYGHQPIFLQSVEEIALSLISLFEDPEKGDFYKRAFVTMAEPERVIAFRVPWEDDEGNMQFNRGWRVEFSR